MKTEAHQQTSTNIQKHDFGKPHISTQLFAEMILAIGHGKTTRTGAIFGTRELFARFVFSPALLNDNQPLLSRDATRIGYFCFTPENIQLVMHTLSAADFSLAILYKTLGFPKNWSEPLTLGILDKSVHAYLLIGSCADLVAASPQIALATSHLLSTTLGIPPTEIAAKVGANKLHRANATVYEKPPKLFVREHLLFDATLMPVRPQALCVIELPLRVT